MTKWLSNIFSSSNNNIIDATYKLISEFEKSSERDCSKVDKANEKIYSRLLSQAQKAQDAIKNSGLSMNIEVPIPPRPSNRDRFILWKKRNIEKRVIDQTEAVLYLETKGYKYNIHYEAYQAIDLANEIKKTNNEQEEWQDKSKNFNEVYTARDKNILRRRSVRALSRPENMSDKSKSKSNIRKSLYGFETEMETDTDVDYDPHNLINRTYHPHQEKCNLKQTYTKTPEYIETNNRHVRNRVVSIVDEHMDTYPIKPIGPPASSNIILPSKNGKPEPSAPPNEIYYNF